MQLTIRLLREADGRWIADIPELPGVTVYGSTSEEATPKAQFSVAAALAGSLSKREADKLRRTAGELRASWR
jgi:predicted RNase H-like HicB family nuclease